ncbi:MAG: LamG-like jellyroll fold domain-containing protein [Planctomycetota bacterium]
MEIIFCKQCGRRIKQDELQQNQFTLVDNQYFCTTCMPVTPTVAAGGGDAPPRRKSSAMTRPKTTAQSVVVRSKTGKQSAIDGARSPSAHAMPAQRPKSEKKPTVAILAGLGVAVLAIVVLAVTVLFRGNTPPVKTQQDANVVGPQPSDSSHPNPTPDSSTRPQTPPVSNTTPGAPSLETCFNDDIQHALAQSQAAGAALLTCPTVAQPPVLDGDLSDPCWATAAVFDNFTADATGRPAAESHQASTVRMVHCHGVLYICGEADIPEGTANMKATLNQRDAAVWNEECFECFFAPPTAKERYSQIAIGPKGAVFDLEGRIGETRDSAVNFPSLKCATKIAANKWTFELSVAATDLYGLATGRWHVNFFHDSMPTAGPHQGISWKPVGDDYHAWPEYPQIDFQGESAADLAAAQNILIQTLPEYVALRRTAAACAAQPLPFDPLNLDPRPRSVTPPYVPGFTIADAGKNFDTPIGSVGYFTQTMTLRPDSTNVGLLRMGAFTTGATAHLRMTVKLTGGTADHPRVVGLVVHTPFGSPTTCEALTGLVVVNGQISGFAASRTAPGAPPTNENTQVPIVVLPDTARPLDLDFCLEPDRIQTFVDGRLLAELPWPGANPCAADVLGLFVQNTGCDLYKLLITPGMVKNSLQLPPWGQVLYAAQIAAHAPPGGDLLLYPDPSAALDGALATLRSAYDTAHPGQPLPPDGPLAGRPALDFKLPVHGGMPCHLYVRIRNAGAQTGVAPTFWLQVSGLADTAFADFAPQKSQAFLVERTTTNGHDWGWTPLVDPATKKPVTLTFQGDGEVSCRLITGAQDAALDQILLLPSQEPCAGSEINDDSWYVGGELDPTFAWKGVAAPEQLAAADAVQVAGFKTDDSLLASTANPNPTGNPAPTPVGPPPQSADGFVANVSLRAAHILSAAAIMPGFSDQVGAQFLVPPPLVKAHFFQADHAAWADAAAPFSFDLKGPAMVFLGCDASQPAGAAMVRELAADGFEPSALRILQTGPDASYQLLRKRFPAGPVNFAAHNFTAVAPLVFVLPLDTAPRQAVDMSQPLPELPGLPIGDTLVHLSADEANGAVDLDKAITATLHRVDVTAATPLGAPAWVFYGIPPSAGREATDEDASYITLADGPPLDAKQGAISFWIYPGGSLITRHQILCRKDGNRVRGLEMMHGYLSSSFGDRAIRAKTEIPSYKWTLVVWNFGPKGQQFIIDGHVEEWQNTPADLSAGGEMRIGNNYQRDSLEGLLGEFCVYSQPVDHAKPKDGIPPALRLSMQMEQTAEAGAVAIYGFDGNLPLPHEADLSGHGLDATWENYRGFVSTGVVTQIEAARERVAEIKHGTKGNPCLTLPMSPSLLLPSGSLYITVNLDKAALRKLPNDEGRCMLLQQTNAAGGGALLFGDIVSPGFFFANISAKSPTSTSWKALKARADLEGGIWYRFAFTWTPKTLRIYQDGKLVGEQPNDGFMLDGKTKALQLFVTESDPIKGFVGSVGEVRIFPYARTVWN